MVDLPEAERPVSQTVAPRWPPRRAARSAWVRPGCQVMLLVPLVRGGPVVWAWEAYVAICGILCPALILRRKRPTWNLRLLFDICFNGVLDALRYRFHVTVISVNRIQRDYE
jgi:hypothetical protein